MDQNSTIKICLLGATFHTHNLGVSALAAGIIKSIYHNFPQAKIILFDYEKEELQFNFKLGDNNIPIHLINARFSKKLYLKNNIFILLVIVFIIRLIPIEKIRNKLFSKNYYLNHVFESDIVASIAGGDSFSDIYGIVRFLYVSLPQILAILLGKKLILLPQTLGPFNRKIVRIIARYILQYAKIIYSRDHVGLVEMRKFLNQSDGYNNLKFCYDVGFIVDPVLPHDRTEYNFLLQQKQNKAIIGINVSGLLYMGGYTQNNMFGLKLDYRELIDEVIHFFIESKDLKILLIPHVFGSPGHLESDFIICNRLFQKFKPIYEDSIQVVHNSYNQNEIKAIINVTDFFIGSRMHACIAALSQGIPAVAISYSKKFYGVLQSIDFESLVADPCRMDKIQIMSIIDETFNRRNMIRQQLQKKIPAIQKKVLNLFNEIMRNI